MLARGIFNMGMCLVMLELFLRAKVVLNDHHLLAINVEEGPHPVRGFSLLSGIDTFCDNRRITPKIIKKIIRFPTK